MGRKRNAAGSVDADDATKDPRFIAALARGIELLRVFKPQDRWLSHREIVRRIALPPATVSRLTFTLTAMGYLKHRQDVGEYALSPAVLGLGFSMLGNFDIARIARPTMQALADKCQAAVSLGARHGLEMIYVAHSRSTARPIEVRAIGRRAPTSSPRISRAVLCGMSPGERDMLMQRIAQAEGDGWPAVKKRLAEVQQQFDTSGFVTTEGEWDPSISAAAVPVVVGDGRTLLSLSVGGASSWLHSHALREEVGPLLVEAAGTIVSAIHAADWKD
jgi:DNA-binding IclR family transcriptional regulator